MIDLTPFFSTIAQVTFTLAGLLVVGLAGDTESRRFWFHRRSRAIFATTSLLLLLIPGVFSIGSLVFLSSNTGTRLVVLIPAWPFSAMVTAFFYLLILFFVQGLKRDDDYYEFVRLGKIISIVSYLRLFVLIFSFSGLCGVLGYWNKYSITALASIEIMMGFFVSLAVLLGTITALSFFRFDAKLREKYLMDHSNSSPLLSPKETNGNITQYYRGQKHHSKENSLQSIALIILTSILAGVLISKLRDNVRN